LLQEGRVQLLQLKELDQDSALQLLTSRRPDILQDPDESNAAKKICKFIGNLPLALELFASHLATIQALTAQKFLKQLEQVPSMSPQQRPDSADYAFLEERRVLFSLFNLIYEKLDQHQIDPYFFLLSSFAVESSIKYDFIENAFGNSTTCGWAVKQLREISLLSFDMYNRVILHPLVITFARGLQDASKRKTYKKKFVDIMADFILGHNEVKDIDAVLPEISHIEYAINVAADNGFVAELKTLYLNYARYLGYRCEFNQQLDCLEKCLALYEQDTSPNLPQIAALNVDIGRVMKTKGDFMNAKTRFQKAVAIYQQTLGPDHAEVANSLNELGGIFHELGDFNQALSHFEHAYAINEKDYSEETPQMTSILQAMAKSHFQIGDFNRAKSEFENVLQLRRVYYSTRQKNHQDIAFSYTPEYIIQSENQKIQQKFTDYFKNYNELPVLSSSNISELFPNPTPLGFSIFNTVFAGNKRKQGAINAGRRTLGYAPISKKEQTELFLAIGHQARMNLLIDALTYRLPDVDRNLYLRNAVKRFMAIMREDEEKANYPEGDVYIQTPNLKECEEYFGLYGPLYLKRYAEFLRLLQKQKIPAILKKVPSKFKRNDDYYRHESAFLASTIKRMKTDEIIQKLEEYVEYLRKDICVLYVIIARIGFLSTFLIKKELKDSLNNDLICLFDDDGSGSQKRDANFVDKAFNALLTREECPEDYKKPDQRDFIHRDEHGEIDMDYFLKHYGHIGSLDIKEPRFNELSLEILITLLQTQDSESSKSEPEKSIKIEEFYDNYKTLEPRKTNDFKQWVKYASMFMALRERGKFEFLKVLYLIKKLVIELQLKTNLNDLVYYLELEELISLDKKNLPIRRLRALQRKAYHEASSRLRISNVIKDSNAENLSKQSSITVMGHQNYKEVKGNTIHYGDAEGISLIARSTQEYYEKLVEYRGRGVKDIIGIFKAIELSYCNLNELSGIVTENGGYLAHAATIAREYNIPYISDIPIGYFRDGYYVILDTNNHKVIYRESN
jgi:phosphohistidine swiveling domain-containing protein